MISVLSAPMATPPPQNRVSLPVDNAGLIHAHLPACWTCWAAVAIAPCLGFRFGPTRTCGACQRLTTALPLLVVEELLLWRDPVRSGLVLGGVTFLYILLVGAITFSCLPLPSPSDSLLKQSEKQLRVFTFA